MKGLTGRFSQDATWSLLGGVIPAVVGLSATPILIQLLTVDQFALASLVFSFNLFFFVYDAGLTRAMHFFSPKNEYRNPNNAGCLIASCLLVGFLVGVILMFVFVLITPFVVSNWLKVDDVLKSEAIFAFRWSSVGIIPALLINSIKGYLEGRKCFRSANLCKIISGVSLFAFPVVSVLFSNSIISLSLSVVFSRFFSLIIYFRYVLIDFKFSDLRVRGFVFSKIINYAFWAALSGFFTSIFVYGDRFIVGGYVDSVSLSAYIGIQDVLIRYLIVPWSISVVLTPYFSCEKYNQAYIRTCFLGVLKKVFVLTVCFAIMVFIALEFLVPIWFTPNFIGIIQHVGAILAVGVAFAGIAQLPLVFLYSHGKVKLLTAVFTIEGLLYLLLAPAVFDTFGVVGAAYVWSFRLLFEAVLLSCFSYRFLRIL